MAKGASDSRLLSLWRKAVLSYHGHKCFFCGTYGDATLQCHHIVRRRRVILRFDYRNGIPLCAKCHQFAHTKEGEMEIMRKHRHYDYCVVNERLTYKQYLVENGLTDAEFRQMKKEELLEVIKREEDF